MSSFKVKLYSPPKKEIALTTMPVGSYAEIMQVEGDQDRLLGKIIFRSIGDAFVLLDGGFWDNHYPKITVRVLEPGEKFTVTVL